MLVRTSRSARSVAKIAALTALTTVAWAAGSVGPEAPSEAANSTGRTDGSLVAVSDPVGGKQAMQRVIVTLKIAAGSDIASAQATLVEALKPLGVEVIRAYGSLPQMALSVTPAALAALNKRPDVVSVAPDGLNKTF